MESRKRVISQRSVYCGLEINVTEIIPSRAHSEASRRNLQEIFLKALRG